MVVTFSVDFKGGDEVQSWAGGREGVVNPRFLSLSLCELAL